MADESNEYRPRTVRGLVVSDKMDKSIVVKVERLVLHPMYKKYIRKFTKYHAHDESNVAKEGDTVEIYQTRPISKKKRWRLGEVLSSRAGA
ncbi:MAG: 30S ribosomal protein S17 [Planctomycetota bacterium]